MNPKYAQEIVDVDFSQMLLRRRVKLAWCALIGGTAQARNQSNEFYKKYIEPLEAQLAECYRLTGADTDGNEDWRLAEGAVEAVRRFREEFDSETNEYRNFWRDLTSDQIKKIQRKKVRCPKIKKK